MIKIPVENLGLFEQLDRTVVAFFKKQETTNPYDLNVSITQEHFDKKRQELEPLGFQAVQIPLGMALDNVIQQAHFKDLIIGDLAPEEIIVSKEALMPMKDIVDSFCTLLENFSLTVLKKVMKLLIWVLIVQLVTVRHMKLLNVF